MNSTSISKSDNLNSNVNKTNKENNKPITSVTNKTLSYENLDIDSVKQQMKNLYRQSLILQEENIPKNRTNSSETTLPSFYEIKKNKMIKYNETLDRKGKQKEIELKYLNNLDEEVKRLKILKNYLIEKRNNEIKLRNEFEESERNTMKAINTSIEEKKTKFENLIQNCQVIKSDLIKLESEYTINCQLCKKLNLKNKEEDEAIKDKERYLENELKNLYNYKAEELNIKNKNEENVSRIKDLGIIHTNHYDYMSFLNNEFQESKGNIRVFCRVRPKIEKEIKDDNTPSNYIEVPNSNTIIINGLIQKSNIGKDATQSKETFHFDRVFKETDTQEEVFKEISQLVQSALDGYKVCIFAYGQTGSGKTYTMEGDYNNSSSHGIIQRSSEKIFATLKELKTIGWVFKVELSFLEVYLENVRDLLSKSDDNVMNKNNKMEKPSTYIVNSYSEMLPYLDLATDNRIVAETKCNDISSRSHR